MTKTPDIERLAAILRHAAQSEVMPRFRNLGADDIRRKTSATDLVTEADEAAERFITVECAGLAPDALVVGEEAVAADPGLLDRLNGADLAIVLDPIDGTANFAAGVPLFAVMAAVVARGETVGGIIYDPLGDDWMVADKHAGARLLRPDGEARALRTASAVAMDESVGTLSATYFPGDRRRALLPRLDAGHVVANYRCAGHEYRLLASGGSHFSVYSKLMPWDHLAGALIVAEAGGHVAKVDGSPLTPRDRDGTLIAACNEAMWDRAAGALFPTEQRSA